MVFGLWARLRVCVTQTAYFDRGYMQEKITGNSYNHAGKSGRWAFSYVLNTGMNVCGFVLALIVWRLEIAFSPAAKRAADELPPWNALHWFRPALSQTLASPIGYLALNYINFPMLVKLDV